jgi:hypothetical protein
MALCNYDNWLLYNLIVTLEQYNILELKEIMNHAVSGAIPEVLAKLASDLQFDIRLTVIKIEDKTETTYSCLRNEDSILE